MSGVREVIIRTLDRPWPRNPVLGALLVILGTAAWLSVAMVYDATGRFLWPLLAGPMVAPIGLMLIFGEDGRDG